MSINLSHIHKSSRCFPFHPNKIHIFKPFGFFLNIQRAKNSAAFSLVLFASLIKCLAKIESMY